MIFPPSSSVSGRQKEGGRVRCRAEAGQEKRGGRNEEGEKKKGRKREGGELRCLSSSFPLPSTPPCGSHSHFNGRSTANSITLGNGKKRKKKKLGFFPTCMEGTVKVSTTHGFLPRFFQKSLPSSLFPFREKEEALSNDVEQERRRNSYARIVKLEGGRMTLSSCLLLLFLPEGISQ